MGVNGASWRLLYRVRKLDISGGNISKPEEEALEKVAEINAEDRQK